MYNNLLISEIAIKSNVTVGKWMIFKQRSIVDETWQKITEATVAGKLGCSAKVSYIIVIYICMFKVFCVGGSKESVLYMYIHHIPYIRNRLRKKMFANFVSLGAFTNIFLEYLLLITKKSLTESLNLRSFLANAATNNICDWILENRP